MINLLEKLRQYSESDAYPFHMPGHKRRPLPGDWGDFPCLDITEIEGFDDLNHPKAFFREAMEETAAFCGAKLSYFGVNGSTGCLLAAIYAATRRGDAVVAARNCHKAVWSGVRLRGLIPYYVMPETGSGAARPVPEKTGGKGKEATEAKEALPPFLCGRVLPGELEAALYEAERREKEEGRSGRIAAVILTSPTYEGILSDIPHLAETAHRHGAVLIVDEAHGAHLMFGEKESRRSSAVFGGADFVVQSLHKTLPCLTQTALLHLCSDRVQEERAEEAMRMFQTSSPSYLLSASILAGLSFAKEHPEEFAAAGKRLRTFREAARDLSCLCLLDLPGMDPYKLVLWDRSGRRSGYDLAMELRERYRLEPEMACASHVILMTSVRDTEEGFSRLQAALREMDGEIPPLKEQESHLFLPLLPSLPGRVLTPAEAEEKDWEAVPPEEAAGRIAFGSLYQVPPEIPLILPGERIRQEDLLLWKRTLAAGGELSGDLTGAEGKIRVIREER